jgi:hypothetical protein
MQEFDGYEVGIGSQDGNLGLEYTPFIGDLDRGPGTALFIGPGHAVLVQGQNTVLRAGPMGHKLHGHLYPCPCKF